MGASESGPFSEMKRVVLPEGVVAEVLGEAQQQAEDGA
jgi:hypothetical protein